MSNFANSSTFFVQVHDRRDEDFIVPWNKFPGEGQAVRGKKDESLNAVSSPLPGLFCKTSHRYNQKSDLRWNSSLLFLCFLLVIGKKLSMDRFLSRLPKVVVKAGRVIDIRDSVRAALLVSSKQRGSTSFQEHLLSISICTHRSRVFSR